MSDITVAETRIVHIGDTGPAIELAIAQKDGITARNLTGYACWFTFCHEDAAPHVVRAGVVHDAANGILRYYLSGDEYNDDGTVSFRATIMHPNWNGGSNLYGFYEQTTPLMYRRVLVNP